jgi:hypothetical protein
MFGIDPSALLKHIEAGAEQEIVSEVKNHMTAVQCPTHNSTPQFQGLDKKEGGGWKVNLGYCCDQQKQAAESVLSGFNLL